MCLCFFTNFVYVVRFGCAGSSLLLGLFSSCGGHSLVVVRGFPIAVASVLAERGLSGAPASAVVARRLSSCGVQANCSATCGIFPDQGSNLCLLH